MKKVLVLLVALVFVSGLFAKPMTRKELATYAQSLKGLKKGELKAAIFELSQPKTLLSYGSGADHTWAGFYKTDRYGEDQCRDRYSNMAFYFTGETASISGMNIEHSFPKSWWGGSTSVSAYKDLYNLMPSEEKINSSKSNYGMGKVTAVATDNGCTKVGSGNAGGTFEKLWEPADKWKGDFSRGYMYMATTYQNYTWSDSEALVSLEQNAWPTLRQWAYTLYLEWTRADKVDQIEVDRNNAVHDIQGNRNLFVDFPELAEYVWGKYSDMSFDPETALTSASDDPRYEKYLAGEDWTETDPNQPVTEKAKASLMLVFKTKVGQPFNGLVFTNDLKAPAAYSSSNEEVATVDQNGNVTIKGKGETVITYSIAETETMNAAQESYKIKVEE